MRTHRWLIVILAVSVLLLASIAVVLAQSGGGYDLTWNSIDGGGYMFSTGGGYSLGGTLGQPDTGSLNGGSYQLVGGFWGGASINYSIYLPLVLKNF